MHNLERRLAEIGVFDLGDESECGGEYGVGVVANVDIGTIEQVFEK